eukprot:CAMPEP_0113880406 /NCGR_PEP_ID=MMETSP0780_2-20120614/7768_1 /TAXON_ID=652834 /ORGANISM="Palpitomonas bilix" /LENGTH=229 /DNA_ID=CAMNT_0000867079 /DNA_START=374 /DNA_END=1063 /DNA_ORIENTATION=+ /assembly_acc=CAM_ASM_000599
MYFLFIFYLFTGTRPVFCAEGASESFRIASSIVLPSSISTPAIFISDGNVSVEMGCKASIGVTLPSETSCCENLRVVDPRTTILEEQAGGTDAIIFALNSSFTTLQTADQAEGQIVAQEVIDGLAVELSLLSSAVNVLGDTVQNLDSNMECRRGFYGDDCQPCGSCSERGMCQDGKSGSGTCLCFQGATGTNCEACCPGFFGTFCDMCDCPDGWTCDDGVQGRGCVFGE